MTIAKGIALLVGLLCSPTVVAQAPSGKIDPFGFQDIHLGMSIAEFKTRHPAPRTGPRASPLHAPASCLQGAGGPPQNAREDATRGAMRCDYSETYLDIQLRVSTIFVGGKLALIEVEPPTDTVSCFEPPPAESRQYLFYSANCKQYQALLHALTDNLGSVVSLASIDKQGLNVSHWENDSSIAEFEDYMCGPWDGSDRGWSKAVSEVLEGTYCGQSDILDARQPVMLYLDKELSQTLIKHLAE